MKKLLSAALMLGAVAAMPGTGTAEPYVAPVPLYFYHNGPGFNFFVGGILVGRSNPGHEWRCSRVLNGHMYYSTGSTQASARRTLEKTLGVEARCRRSMSVVHD